VPQTAWQWIVSIRTKNPKTDTLPVMLAHNAMGEFEGEPLASSEVDINVI
jgi:hypothetical protein